MKRKLTLVVLMAAMSGMFLTGCDNSSTDSKPAGTNTPPPPSTNVPAPAK